jgi:chromosome segregation ATPase
VKCADCGYEKNEPGDHSCGLCGGRFGGVLPKSDLSSRTRPQERYTRRLDGPTTRLTGRLKKAEEPNNASTGLKRLEDAQARVTRKLERLSDVQAEGVPILRAQIQAERDDKALVEEIAAAEAELTTSSEELEVADSNVRQQRKKIAALRFELRSIAEERMRTLEEQQTLNAELDDMRRIAGELDGAPRQAPQAEAEIAGLQTVCVRLSERITMLKLTLDDRESCMQWLLQQSDATVEEEKARELETIAKALDGVDDPEEFLHWLRGQPTEREAT